MTRALRVVKPEDPAGDDMSMAEAIRGMAERLVASKPVAVLVAYEVAADKAGKPGTIKYETIPPAGVTAQGFVDQLYDQLHPEPLSE